LTPYGDSQLDYPGIR
nr:prophenoloxidase, PPO {internal fragment} [Galleria mellonella=wax moths, larvae, hemolymph, Peptide Partial, 15 aa] [Galleria mellonella]